MPGTRLEYRVCGSAHASQHPTKPEGGPPNRLGTSTNSRTAVKAGNSPGLRLITPLKGAEHRNMCFQTLTLMSHV